MPGLPVLVIDVGGADLDLDNWERAGQAEPERVGDVSRAYAGNQYSSVRAEFMVVPLVSGPVSTAEYQQVDSIFALGAQVPCQGSAFKGRPDVVTCSGKLTAEMVPGGIDDVGDPLWILNLTLTECDNAGTALTAATTTVYLTNVTSPDDPGDGSVNIATTNVADDPFAAGVGSETLLDGETIPTCGDPMAPNVGITCDTAVSSAAERSWLSPATVNGGWITGAPTVYFLSGGGTGDHWALQNAMCKIFVVRGGVDIAEWDTAWSDGNGGFGGGTISMAAPAVVFEALPGDRIRVEVYGRAARHGGYNTTDLQTIGYGNGGGGNHYGRLQWGGSVAFE